MNKKLWLGALITTVALTASGCSNKQREYWRDAPIDGEHDNTPAEVYTMPDGFSNFASKCDRHGNRVFVTFKGDEAKAAIAVVPQDPTCKK